MGRRTLDSILEGLEDRLRDRKLREMREGVGLRFTEARTQRNAGTSAQRHAHVLYYLLRGRLTYIH